MIAQNLLYFLLAPYFLVGLFYLLVILYSFFHGEKHRTAHAVADLPAPHKVYIIVPFFNEEHVLPNKINNLLDLTYPDLQFILVDDASTDRSYEVAQSFSDDRLILLKNKGKGKALAQTMAMEHVSQDSIVVFNDCNVFLEKDSVAHIVSAFQENVGGCSGNVTIWEEIEIIGIEGYHWQIEKEIKNFESFFGSTIGFDGGFYAIRPELFTCFPADALSDFEQAIDILAKGYRVVFAPQAKANEYESRELLTHFSARRRVTTRTLWALFRALKKLSSMSWGTQFFLFSNKYLRYYCYYFLTPLLILLLWVISRNNFDTVMTLGGVLLSATLAGAIFSADLRRTLIVGVALYAGLYDFLRGEKISTWMPDRKADKKLSSEKTAPILERIADQTVPKLGKPDALNILFLTHRIPYPPNKGDKIRSFNELKFLAKDHKIYLGTLLDSMADEKYIQKLKPYTREICVTKVNSKLKLIKTLFSSTPFSVDYFYSQKIQEFVDNTLATKNIDAIFCFSSSMAEYIYRTPLYRLNRLKGINLVMDFIDLDSDKWVQYADYSHFPLNQIYRIESQRLFQYEQKINLSFNHSVFVSPREIKVLKRLFPLARNLTVISNGVDCNFFKPKKFNKHLRDIHNDASPSLVFTGVMDYFANEDGVIWFSDTILPRIRRVFPNVRFYIVGKSPTKAVLNLAKRQGIIVTGYVQDIREYYEKADICVIPLRIARGTQNKVLEAMATNNAVVATSNASEGIVWEGEESEIAIADGEQDFADKVIGLLHDKSERNRLAQQAMQHVRKHNSWETNMLQLDKLLRQQPKQ